MIAKAIFPYLTPRGKPGRIALALAVLALFAAFATWRHWQNHNLVLNVGFSQFAPYLIDNGSAEPDGLAAEMVRRAARGAGLKLNWTRIKNVDDALRQREIDIYPLGTLTAWRKRDFHVSAPWWENEIALISLEQSPLKSAAETARKRIGIRGLPVVEVLAEDLFPKAYLIRIPRTEDMIGGLCDGYVDGFFLDLRLLESHLLKGNNPCQGRAMHVASIPKGSLSLGTLATPNISNAADALYEQIAQLSANGTLSELASRWSMYNAYQSRHVKDVLEAQHRAALMHYGLGGMMLILVLFSFHTNGIRRARVAAESARAQSEESNHRFNAFMRHMPAVAFIKDASGRMSYINESFCKLFEQKPEQAIGKLDAELWPLEQARKYRENDLRVLSRNRGEEVLETAITATGETRSFLSYKFPFENPAGERFIGGVAIDITDRLRAEEALKLSQFSIDCSQDTMLWIDDAGRIFNANRAACRNLAYSREELVGLHISGIDPLFDQTAFFASRERLKRHCSLTEESVHQRKDGITYPVEIRQNFLEFQGAEYSCCMSRDITERKLAEHEMARQAKHDALTGLPNRRFLETWLTKAIETAGKRGSTIGVLYLDLDGFKLVNDTLGHGIGDQLLKQVAARLSNNLPEGSMLFRMGGDEFTLVLTGLSDQPAIALAAHQLLGTLHASFGVEGHDLSVTASVGVSLFPQDGDEGSELLRKADGAMYESKRQGKNRIHFFTPEMGHAVRERLDLESHLRRALERDEFSLVFQPEFCLETGRVLRHEALLRWNHPTLGSVPPPKFIPVAEDTMLIVPIGRWVLEEACRRAGEWQQTGAPGVGVAVNMSLVQFARADLIEMVTEALDAANLPPRLLEIELTESVVMQNVEEVQDKINRLRRLGVTIAVDDFGTGYSSLSYLRHLPVDTLKIDRSFIRDITADASAVSLASALVSIAHSLDMRVVFEGVETAGQLAAIERLGCDVGQGYLLGMPMAKPPVLALREAA